MMAYDNSVNMQLFSEVCMTSSIKSYILEATLFSTILQDLNLVETRR